MAENFLELTTVTYTANQLTIKVKNISGAALDKRLVVEFSPPADLVDNKINAAARAAATTNDDTPGAQSVQDLVTGPQGWSVWARRETSDSAVWIDFINDMDQNGRDLPSPVAFGAGGEFTVKIPLDPTTSRNSHVDVLYSYQREDEEAVRGKIQLKPDQTTWNPDVTLFTKHKNPTMVKPGDLVKIEWKITDGVSATLRGPLPSGNAEMTLSTKPDADFKLAAGSMDVRVMSAVTYVL